MYLHDIGDAATYKNKKYNLKDMNDKKDLQMKYGAALSKKILTKIKGFTKKEIGSVCRLVKTHDIINKKRNYAEQLVFEADSLAMIDEKRAPSTFSRTEQIKFTNFFIQKRMSRFKTKTGKKYLKKLFAKYKKQYNI